MLKSAVNKSLAKKLRKNGKTLVEIGRTFGVTRQRIQQILGNTGRLNVYPLGYRRCYGCKKTLKIEDFYRGKSVTRCIKCTKNSSREYGLKKRDRYYKECKKGGKYYLKNKARNAVCLALKNGIIKKGKCKIKNDECLGRIEAHHLFGYDKENWLKIEWYCARHHRWLDKVKFGNKI